MTEIIETEEIVDSKFTLKMGEFQPAGQKTRIFNTLSELTSYISAFRIENGQYAKGILRDSGKTVYQITYLNEDL